MNNIRGDIKRVVCTDLNLSGISTSIEETYIHSVDYTSTESLSPIKIRAFLVNSENSFKYEQTVRSFTKTNVVFTVEPRTHEFAKFDELELSISYLTGILKIKVPVTKNTISKINNLLTYDRGSIKLPISNMLYPRIRLGFPQWGTIEKNDISNGTKLLEPLFTPFYDSYHKIIKFNIKSKFKKPYDKYENIFFGVNPNIVLRKELDNSNTRLHESGCIESLPKSTSLKPFSNVITLSQLIIDPDIIQDFDFTPFHNKYLYIKKVNFNYSLDTQNFVYIKGENEFGEKVEERVEIVKDFFTVSRKKFYKINSITSDNNILVSNFIDCRFDHYYIKDIKTAAPIVDKDLFSFHPKVIKAKNNELNRSVLHIHNNKKELSEIAYKFDIESSDIKSLIIDEHLRVLWTDGSKLYSSTLNHDLSKDLGGHPSNNNNEVISVNDTNTLLGDWIDVTIDTDVWPNKTPMIIQIKNKDSIKYYDQTTETFIDNISFFYPQKKDRFIELSVKVENEHPYIFSVISDDFNKRYTASSHTNVLKSISTKDCTGNLFIYDEEIRIGNNPTTTTIINNLQESDKIRVIIEPQSINSFNWSFTIAGQVFGNNGSTCKEYLYDIITGDGENNLPVIFELDRNKILNEFFEGIATCTLNLSCSSQYNSNGSKGFKICLIDSKGSAQRLFTSSADLKIPITFDKNTKEIKNAI